MHRRISLWFSFMIGMLLVSSGCSSPPREGIRIRYEPAAFRRALLERVPQMPESLLQAPFEVPEAAVELARRRVDAQPRGPRRIEVLVDLLSAAPPEGLGLGYDWRVSASAARTFELGRGNCVSLASVLVGLGRELGWPVYYAEARPRQLTTHDLEDVKIVLDHMVVVVLSKTVQRVIDFTGRVDGDYQIRIIDDLTAYAHLINNIASQRLVESDSNADPGVWSAALEGFRMATAIQPDLARAWNNQGVALTRLGHFEEARVAYLRALELDSVFGSVERNLAIMETRSLGTPRVIEAPESAAPAPR